LGCSVGLEPATRYERLPRALDFLPGYDEKWTTVLEAMGIRPTRIKKVLARREPLHLVIKRKQKEKAQITMNTIRIVASI
jgi:hypothetical protein